MKLQYLAVFVSAVFIANTTNAVEIYNKYGNKLDFFGKLNGTHYISGDENQYGDRSFASLGFKGEAKISEGLIGFGTWEHKISARNHDSRNHDNFTYLGFVGLKFGDIGSFDYGRNYGVLYDVSAWTDIMPELGGVNATITDNFISGRANGVFTYRNKNLFGIVDGLNFALQYQGKNDNKHNKGQNLKKDNGDGYGMSVSYNLGNGVSTSAAYANSNRTFSQRSLHVGSIMENNSKKAKAYSLGVKYDVNNLYLAAIYNENHNMTPIGKFAKDDPSNKFYGFAKKVKNIELVAQYQLDFGMRPSIGYLQSKIDSNFDKRQDIKKYIELGASYSFNKNMLAFVDYRINLLSKNNFTKKAHISTNNIVALGVNYMF